MSRHRFIRNQNYGKRRFNGFAKTRLITHFRSAQNFLFYGP